MLNNKILPVILTKNEELNISKCLQKLKWAKEVIVFDSYSNDRTINIARNYVNVRIFRCKKNFDYVDKLNFIMHKTYNKFILLLDADYVCSEKLVLELKNFNPSDNVFGYKFKIYNKINGKILKENLYPDKILLFRSNKNLFKKSGHKEIFQKKGIIKEFNNYLIHEDRKNFKFWIKNQYLYSVKDSKKIYKSSYNSLTLQDKIRRFPFLMNLISFVYYTFRLNLLRFGVAGIYYILARQVYEFFLSINVLINLLIKKNK